MDPGLHCAVWAGHFWGPIGQEAGAMAPVECHWLSGQSCSLWGMTPDQ